MGGIKRKDGKIMALSVSDQLACLAGFRAICKAQAETTYCWAYTSTSTFANCTSQVCSIFRHNLVVHAFSSSPLIAGFDTFHTLVDPDMFCPACAHQAEGMHNTGREKFWALLPSLFDLPPWEELKKERELYVL